MKPIAIGTEDFKKIIETGSLFIDKTLFIKEIIDDSSQALCLPRPRRFGKTLNMSMLYYYFSNEFNSKKLFEGLNITKEGQRYLDEMNKYPTIFISLKDTKRDTYEDFIDAYKDIMKSLYDKYKKLLEDNVLDETEKEDYLKITRKEEERFLSNA